MKKKLIFSLSEQGEQYEQGKLPYSIYMATRVKLDEGVQGVQGVQKRHKKMLNFKRKC